MDDHQSNQDIHRSLPLQTIETGVRFCNECYYANPFLNWCKLKLDKLPKSGMCKSSRVKVILNSSRGNDPPARRKTAPSHE